MSRPHASKDSQVRFHEEWLGLAQPIEGLVFSVPVLADAQVRPVADASLTTRFRRWLRRADEGDAAPAAEDGHLGDGPVTMADLRAFLEGFLGYDRPGMLVGRDELADDLRFHAPEGGQEIRPSLAIAREAEAADDPFAEFTPAPSDEATDGDAERERADDPETDAASPHAVLLWDLRDDGGEAADGLSLDAPEDVTGPWRYPPTAKWERFLRHVRCPVGLLTNGRELRLVHAPPGESTSHLTFRFADMAQPAGRPLLAAFELLLHARRTYTAAPEHSLAGLLRASRRRQADVTQDLAEQVKEAVELLLEGFEQAALREGDAVGDGGAWLRAALEEEGDHLYQGVLSVILRLVFLLYAEDQSLMPVDDDLYARHLSVKGLHDELVEDAGRHPESMHHRFGAYGRLLSLFRAVYLGVRHGALALPPRRGRLFDPSTFPFLEGGMPGTTAAIVLPEARAEVRPPMVDDGVVHAVLDRLVIFEGQRLSYRSLDVEQVGSVYESLMGYHVQQVASPAVRLGRNRAWVETAALREMKPTPRKKWLKETCGLTTAQLAKIDDALKSTDTDAALADALLELSPGRARQRHRHRAGEGKLVLQPGEERRRSGSHYTPRSLTERIVRRTLEPVLACLGDEPTADQLLDLKVCDPAMGSGAFLVEACRHLADHLVAAWTREGVVERVAEEHGDAHLHARRLVAQRCLYGVDKNAAAVELAKLSLWLVTLSKNLPFTFVDHALRHGDSLVGLDLDQVAAFHWKAGAPGEQGELFTAEIRDALDQAIAHREELLSLAPLEDPESQEEKRRLLDHAEHATAKLRTIADCCAGAFFAGAKTRAREDERDRRLQLVHRWLGDDDPDAEAEVKALAEEIRARHAPFHWWLEYPEVFYLERPDPLAGGEVNGAAHVDAFVGNPPFLGGRGITETIGSTYNEWLREIHDASMNADLSAHFFRRAANLVGQHGTFGLIATNTIAQGDTRLSGLKPLVASGWAIYDATNSMPWPGAAAVTVSVVHAAVGECKGRADCSLDGERVDVINSRLRPTPERRDAALLKSNAAFAFQGNILLGMGFTLTHEERDDLIASDARNAERIFPYIGGKELNTSPTQDFARYVISFGVLSLEEAQHWPDLLRRVTREVKPERERQKRKHLRERWWQFAETRPALMAALEQLDRCLVTARVTKHLAFSLQPTDQIFNEKICVFPLDAFTPFAVLQSRVHVTWAWLLSSTMRDAGINYAASDCFDTFPFPQPDPRTVIPELEAAGEALHDARARFMVDTDQGLTQTYNALKDPTNDDPRVLELRRLHESLDHAVLDAYGWSDMPVPLYCPQTQDEHATLTTFEDEVIDRLYVLNAERSSEETGQRVSSQRAARTSRARREANQAGLFGD